MQDQHTDQHTKHLNCLVCPQSQNVKLDLSDGSGRGVPLTDHHETYQIHDVYKFSKRNFVDR